MKITVKVGTSTLAYPTGHLNIRHIESLVKVLSDIHNAGHDVVLVSSGAIAMGFGKLNMKERPRDMAGKQAAAAVGQVELMYTYDKLFSEYNHTVAQILVTNDDLESENRRYNFEQTLKSLLDMHVLPVINENDTISTQEISVGDNDTLSAIVALAADSDLLILLSDIDGLYSSDPRKNPDAVRISVVEEITDEIKALAGGSGTTLGTGGMATKIKAAELVTKEGMDMVILNGDHPELIYDILEGKQAGTCFKGRKA